MRTLEELCPSRSEWVEIYHNFIGPHMALKGKTSAEKARIEVKGRISD
jgi:hypothetical protein